MILPKRWGRAKRKRVRAGRRAWLQHVARWRAGLELAWDDMFNRGASPLLAASALLVAGCYATAGPPVTFDRCGTGRVIDGCSVDDYPPLIAMLPPWPFPSLLQPIPSAAAPPPADTPASRLLHKLTK